MVFLSLPHVPPSFFLTKLKSNLVLLQDCLEGLFFSWWQPFLQAFHTSHSYKSKFGVCLSKWLTKYTTSIFNKNAPMFFAFKVKSRKRKQRRLQNPWRISALLKKMKKQNQKKDVSIITEKSPNCNSPFFPLQIIINNCRVMSENTALVLED